MDLWSFFMFFRLYARSDRNFKLEPFWFMFFYYLSQITLKIKGKRKRRPTVPVHRSPLTKNKIKRLYVPKYLIP